MDLQTILYAKGWRNFQATKLKGFKNKNTKELKPFPAKNFAKETLRTRQQIWVRVIPLNENPQLRQDVAPTVDYATAVGFGTFSKQSYSKYNKQCYGQHSADLRTRHPLSNHTTATAKHSSYRKEPAATKGGRQLQEIAAEDTRGST